MSNDNVLNTGTTSSTFAPKPTRSVTERKEADAEKRAKLLPAADVVFAEIEKQITQMSTVEFMNLEEMLNDEHFRAELMARKKYVEYLKKLQIKMNNILRERPAGGGANK